MSAGLARVSATRYITPLREGGSLPGLMEADDLGTYVVKFQGAGQGRKVLVAEVVCAGLARALDLPVPRLVTVELDVELAATEPDPEVQDLLRASAGTNLGVDFLPGSLDFDPGAFALDPALAGRVLWFDALTGNVDRSWRNPNLLYWHGEPYLIDHGATLTFHHNWSGAEAADTRAYDASEHVLLGFRPEVAAADAELAPRVTEDVLRDAVAAVPDAWLDGEEGFDTPDRLREAYVTRLAGRLAARGEWLPGVLAAVEQAPPRPEVRAPASRRPAWLIAHGRRAAR
ncbi:HipA family kinase [Amycolatopsis anabasis]|uniref:HipA family kinase n=1 Tax=Amycolatopsis anabasis TaxID=1840409 RepID=UPI00131AFCDF|nr:HipA family kinase [Amycolatopsis anabasis]